MGLLRLTHRRPELTPDDRVIDAVQVMTSAGVGAAAVTVGRKIIGIFAEGDGRGGGGGGGRALHPTTIKEVMPRPVETVVAPPSGGEAAAIMRDRHIRHLAIINGSGDF